MNKRKNKNPNYIGFTTRIWIKTIVVISLLNGYFFMPPSGVNNDFWAIIYLIVLTLISFLIIAIVSFPIWMITNGFVEYMRPLKMNITKRKLAIYGACLIQVLIFWIILYFIEIDIFGKELKKIFCFAVTAPAVFIFQTAYKITAKKDDLTKPVIDDLIDDIDFEE